MSRKTSHTASSKSDRRVNRVRNSIFGTVLVLALVVVGIGLYSTFSTPTGGFVAGEHYQVIEDAPARRPGAPIMVQEFFSYGCVHCRNFDPMIEEWRATLADDVRFERVPATFSPAWTILAQTYYALEALGALERNHDRLFRAIHDTGRQFATLASVADFIDGYGATRDEFLAAATGQPVLDRLRVVEREQRSQQVSGVPTLVVANRYVVGMNSGRKAALEIVDYLIDLERSGGDTAQPPPAEPG